MKQTRNAITFLQAQYRALLQRVVWSRFAFISAFAGVCAPEVLILVSASGIIVLTQLALTQLLSFSHKPLL